MVNAEVRGRWMMWLGSAGVLAFLAVCAYLMVSARQDRAAVEQRVLWMMDLQATEGGRTQTAARAIAACEDCATTTRAAAIALLTPPAGAEAPSYDNAATVSALRIENAGLSARLGAGWRAVEILLVCAVTFALGFFFLLRLALRREAEMSKAFADLAAETRRREEAQRSLREEQAFVRGIFDFAPVGIQVYDAAGVSLKMNAEFARILGVPSRDVGVGSYNILTDPFAEAVGTPARIRPAFEGRVVASAERTVNFGIDANRWDTARHTLVLEELYFPILGDDGTVTHVVALVRDVTEAHKAREQLALSARLATVGTLAAGVAHEINNPLTYVLTNVMWVRRMMESHPDALPADAWVAIREALQDATDGAGRVQSIIRDLGTFSRPSKGAPTAVSLRAAVEPTLRILDHELRHRAQVVNAVPPELNARADPQALGQVLLNLVQNAAHAIAPGDPANQRVEVAAAPGEDGLVRLTISDTGHGVPPEIAGRIFDPFFTTKEVGKGMGLGLALSRRLVESMGGKPTFTTAPGRGTAFHLDLPAGPAPSPGPGPVDPRSPPSGPRGRFLVVDDEPLLVSSVRRLLGRSREVVAVASGTAALQRLQTDQQWDAILLDVVMPGVDGRGVLSALQALCPALVSRVILMSGGGFPPDLEAWWQKFPGPRLEKPFDAGALDAALREVLDAAGS